MQPPIAVRISAAIRCLKGDLSGIRHVLPHRRESETIKFKFDHHGYFATVSRVDDGNIAEIFLSSARTGVLLRNMVNDMAIAASIAIQYGCPAEVLQQSFTRNDHGEPATPIAAAFDHLVKQE